MTTYLAVTLGIDMSRALRNDGARLSKKWLREYLRTNPQKDFRTLVRTEGPYVNGENAVQEDLTLEVRDPSGVNLVAMVHFQPTTDNEWGYQAVVV